MLLHADDDAAAIRRCRSGDIRGLDALMARHQVQALRVAYLLTGDRMQAEDVVQDSFLQVFACIADASSPGRTGCGLHSIIAQCKDGAVRNRPPHLYDCDTGRGLWTSPIQTGYSTGTGIPPHCMLLLVAPGNPLWIWGGGRRVHDLAST